MSEEVMGNTVRIFDTTLRDGEQSPGASMTVEQKVVIARQLEKLGVDVIEAGFAASSEGDFESVRRVAEELKRPRVLSLARAQQGDIERALAAVEGSSHPGIHTFIATSDIHLKHKLRMSREQVIEAGFAASSEGDFESVRRVCEEVTRPRVVSLARAQEGDLERALKAVEGAKNPGIHTFIATSDIHLKHKLRMSREQVIEAAVKAVSFAKQFTDYIEFSAEDASRSDPEFLIQVFREVIRAGANTINVPDTTGYAIPSEFGALMANLIERTAGADRVVWSAHCHNDLGLAVANSLAAVHNGARQIECTINGIGERAGNTSLEEVVMALRTRKNYLDLDTGITTEQLYPTSRLVSQVTGIQIPINKPIVGDNAFAHEAGIHQDGVLKHKQTYEIMTPESIGIPGNRLVMGKHSGRHAFDERLKHLGFNLAREDMNRAFRRFKDLADKKKNVYDEDIEAIVAEEILRVPGQPDRYELLYLSVNSSSEGTPSATVKLRVSGQEKMDYATGDGAVDACYQAITRITGSQSQLIRYNVSAITGGADAQGEVSCVIEDDGFRVSGQGAHTDVIMASALAYINALNKLEGRKRYRQLVEREGP